MQEAALMARVHALEASCRRQRLLTYISATLLFSMVVCAFGFPAAEEVRASAFVLHDVDGVPRARLDIRKGHPSLVFLDAEGNVQAGLGLASGEETDVAAPGQPLLFLGSPPRSEVIAYASATSPLQGATQAALMLSNRGEPMNAITLGVSEAASTLGMLTIGDGGPWGVTPRATLHAPRGASSKLQLRDAEGELTFSSSEVTEFDGSNYFTATSAEDVGVLRRVRPTPPLVEVLGEGVDDGLLQSLAELDGIRRLTIRAAPKLGPDGLSHVAKMTSLIELHIVNSPGLAKRGYAELEGSTIRNLGLVWMPVSDGLVEVLSTMPDLESLVVSGTESGPDLIARLKQALPDVEVNAARR